MTAPGEAGPTRRRRGLAVLWRPVRAVVLALATLVLLIEEWGWRPLAAGLGRLAAWPPLARLETGLRGVRPGVALALFALPAVLLFPLKLLALWLIHAGRVGVGVAVIVAAKLLGTAVVGRLFVLLEPQLLQFGWFARSLGWWRQTRTRLRAALHASPAWRAARRALRRVRTRWRLLWRTRSRRFGG